MLALLISHTVYYTGRASLNSSQTKISLQKKERKGKAAKATFYKSLDAVLSKRIESKKSSVLSIVQPHSWHLGNLLTALGGRMKIHTRYGTVPHFQGGEAGLHQLRCDIERLCADDIPLRLSVTQ